MLQVTDVLTAKKRHAGRKGMARKLRQQGGIPAVVYGAGCTENEYLSLDPKMFVFSRKQFGSSHLYEVAVDEENGEQRLFKALIKNIQSDPMTNRVLHVDLYAVDMQKPIRMNVPVELVGKPAGLVLGGLLTQILHQIAIQCLPDKIPSKLSVDVSPLQVGQSLHAKDVQLPEGVRLVGLGDEPIAALVEPDAAPAEAAATAGAPAAAAGKGAAAKAPAGKAPAGKAPAGKAADGKK